MLHVARLPGLQQLSLQQLAVSDSGLLTLKALRTLQRISLFRNAATTPEGVRELQSAMPDCRIDSD
jgi:hypothetical protein